MRNGGGHDGRPVQRVEQTHEQCTKDQDERDDANDVVDSLQARLLPRRASTLQLQPQANQQRQNDADNPSEDDIEGDAEAGEIEQSARDKDPDLY